MPVGPRTVRMTSRCCSASTRLLLRPADLEDGRRGLLLRRGLYRRAARLPSPATASPATARPAPLGARPPSTTTDSPNKTPPSLRASSFTRCAQTVRIAGVHHLRAYA